MADYPASDMNGHPAEPDMTLDEMQELKERVEHLEQFLLTVANTFESYLRLHASWRFRDKIEEINRLKSLIKP